MLRLARTVAALWMGSLCTICAIVAPLLFATLERPVAGQLAARFFHVTAWLGLALAATLLAAAALRRSSRDAFHADRTALWLIGVSALAPLCSELLVGPLMQHARSIGDMRAVGTWHGVASGLFLVACAGTLALVWRISRPAE
jgi:Domain of unknown function (DUF4149)